MVNFGVRDGWGGALAQESVAALLWKFDRVADVSSVGAHSHGNRLMKAWAVRFRSSGATMPKR